MDADDFPCYCVYDNLVQGSFTEVTPDLKYSDLLRCSKCGYKYWSNTNLPCPECNSHLVQGSATRDRIAELKRVVNAPFSVSYHFPSPNQ